MGKGLILFLVHETKEENMLVPHFHFKGCCEEAIHLYEKAFNTKADTILYNKDMSGNPANAGIGHAEMGFGAKKSFMHII